MIRNGIWFLIEMLVLMPLVLSGCGVSWTDASAAVDTVTIVTPSCATVPEHLAAKEIRRFLYLRTGKVLPIIESSGKLPSKTTLIVVGEKNRPAVKALSDQEPELASSVGSLKSQQYLLRTMIWKKQRVVLITGGDPIGTLYAAYRFAEHFGVRFYLHGDTIPDEQVTLKIPI